MPFARLAWVFAALFLACGVPLFFVEDRSSGRLLAGAATICLGGFALALAASGVQTGVIRLQYSVMTRAGQPRRFWAAVALLVAAGLGAIAAALWMMGAGR